MPATEIKDSKVIEDLIREIERGTLMFITFKDNDGASRSYLGVYRRYSGSAIGARIDFLREDGEHSIAIDALESVIIFNKGEEYKFFRDASRQL